MTPQDTWIAALPFPEIDPVAFAVGPVAVRWYALAYIAGLLLGWRYARLLAARRGAAAAPAKIDDLLFWIAIGVIVGGRIGSVLFYGLDGLLADPLRLFRVAGPHRFDPESLSDRSERFFASERLREQLLVHLREELPYAAHVQIGRYASDGPRVRVEAQILVERPSQRAILLGRGGARLGAIGRGARLGLERLLERPVTLRLHVRVRPNWLRDPRIQAGYRGGA